jgi:hypothetical protein
MEDYLKILQEMEHYLKMLQARGALISAINYLSDIDGLGYLVEELMVVKSDLTAKITEYKTLREFDN